MRSHDDTYELACTMIKWNRQVSKSDHNKKKRSSKQKRKNIMVYVQHNPSNNPIVLLRSNHLCRWQRTTEAIYLYHIIDFSSPCQPLLPFYPFLLLLFSLICRWKYLLWSCANFLPFYNRCGTSQSLAHLQHSNMGKIPTWPNANHEKDVIDILIWNRWLLRVLGIWPLIYPDTTMIEKVLATFSFALCWIVLGLFLVLTSMYTFTDRSIMGEKMKMLGPLGYVFFSMLKYLFLVIRHKSIRRCVQILSTDWRMVQEKYHREIMMRDAEKGHLLSKFCIVFMYCGGLSYNTVMPFLSQTSDANEQNVTVRPMAYLGFDIVFDLQLMPVYVFAFSLQCFIGIVMFNITTSVCCLAAMFVAHACGQIDIVIARVENLFKGERDHTKFEKYMAIIVQHHVRTLR